MRRHTMKMAIGAGVALALGGAWLHFDGRVASAPNPSASSVAEEVATDGARDAGATPRHARAVRPGMTKTYDVTMHTGTALLEEHGTRARVDVQTTLRGRLELAVVSRDGGASHWRATLVPASLEMRAAGRDLLRASDRDALVRDVARPFALDADNRGRVESVQFAAGVSPIARGLARAVVAAAQFAAGDGDGWITEEQDATGECVTRYARVADDRFEKTKQRYARVASIGGLVDPDRAGGVTLEGTATVTLDADGWPAHVEAQHAVAVQAGGTPMARGTVAATLDLVQSSFDPSVAEPADLGARSLLASLDGEAPSAADRDRQLVRGATMDDLMARLRAAKPSDPDRSSTAGRMAALIRLQPAMADRAAKAVIAGLSPDDGGAVLGALSSAGTREAQTALVSVAQSKTSTIEVRTEALAALGSTATPTADTTHALTQALGSSEVDERTTATLALGNAARSLGDVDPAKASSIVDQLMANVTGATTMDDRLASIRSLGNARDSRGLAVLKDALADADPMIRGAAVYALRGMDDPSVDGLIDAALTGDADASVRSNAVSAIDYRPPAAHLAATGMALRSDASDQVRAAIVAFLGREARALPGVLDVLKRTATSDPSPEVRSVASSFLRS